MKSNDAAELIAEIHEERAETETQDRFRSRAALLIAVMAAVLAVGDLGGDNATDDMIGSNIKASDTWSFYQAKNLRQTMYEIEVDELKSRLASGALNPIATKAAQDRIKDYEATIARYDSEPDPAAPDDPLKGEGKKQLSAQAEQQEAVFARASAQDGNFDTGEVFLQLALVLGSVAILAVNRWILGISLALGALGTLLMANGFFLVVPLF